MQKTKKSILLILMILLSLSSLGCSNKEIEEGMNDLEEVINEIEDRGNRFFDRLGDSLDTLMERMEKSIEDFFEERRDDEEALEEVDEEALTGPEIQMDFVSRSMEEAYGEIPLIYEYEFDQEGEDYIFKRLNAYREEKGLQPLERREDLTQSARYKSLAMLQYDYFSHDNPNLGNEPFDHLMWKKLDLKYVGIGENLAFVSNSAYTNRIHAEELFTGWQNSDGHNKQMLSPTHRYVGIGVVRSSESGEYYKDFKVLLGTQHFGN